ncbi:DUF7159 family protein [Mycolicibacterium phlei]
MDFVLGLSMTSSTVRWVLVEGLTGEGATVDRGSFDRQDDAVDHDELLDVILADVADSPLHAIGVTWTREAEDVASGVLDALIARGYGNAIAVSEVEAGEALAAGIAEITEYDDVAVCIVEPDAAMVAMVTGARVSVDRIARPLDGDDAVELPSGVISMLDLNAWQPQAIFVVGSARDVDLVTSTLDDVTEAPVFSAAEADLALARGAALASARTVTALDAPRPRRIPTRVGALTGVLAAASVVFVASASAAIGITLTGSDDTDVQALAGDEHTAVTEKPAAPPAPVKKLSLAEAKPIVAQTIVIAAPPPPAAPVYDPPAYVPPPAPEYSAPAATAPEPAYTPPAPPAYVPPPPPPAYVPPAPQPRLRDRILEKIPIINRFHTPDYSYGR